MNIMQVIGRIQAGASYDNLNAGVAKIFNSGSTYYTSVTEMDDTHAIVAYCDGNNSNYGTACCLTLDNTTITAGTEVVFNSAVT